MADTCAELTVLGQRWSFADFNHRETTKEKVLLAEIARLRFSCDQHSAIVARHETALREGDHRIKNSLQIVASLMALQERREPNAAARSALHAAAARIHAIACMHDALNLSGGIDSLDLGALLGTMCRSLHAMAGDADLTRVEVNAISVQAPIGLAQPLVLIVNEPVVNALRHAFPADRAGLVRIDVSWVDA